MRRDGDFQAKCCAVRTVGPEMRVLTGMDVASCRRGIQNRYVTPMRFFPRNADISVVCEEYMSSAFSRFAGVACAAFILAGCATKNQTSPSAPQPAPPPKPVACAPSAGAEALQGTWYSVSTPRGVGGMQQTLLVLAPDGKMRYQTQLKIRNKARPGLEETGCWTFTNGLYTMQTTESNGDPVDLSDPIYTNRYRVETVNTTTLVLRDMRPGGEVLKARKMPQGYGLR
jgi:hypothetical protein